jgi:hypothetical protein
MRRIGAVLLAMLGASAFGSEADIPEAGSREAIATATTEPRFLSSWVQDIPDSKTVPSPTRFLGHIAGAPGELTRTDRIYAYYRALAAASPRVRVEVIGKSEEGRDILLVIAGDETALRDLEHARESMAALADPRKADEAAMEESVSRTKPFYMLHGGLHSEETGSPEMLMELVYRLAVSESPLIREIRDKVVVLVNPVAEPDGRDREVDWFYRVLKGKTDYENLPPISAPYWGKYVLHDNNRDAVQRRLALTRATQDAFFKWHPIVVHDLHESIPLLCVWTGTGPYNVNIDPITTTEWHELAFHEVTTLTSFGMPGVWTWGFGEGWAHLYADSVAINHNAIGKGYETFGNGTAETVERILDPDEEKYLDKPVTEKDWFRSSPPPKKFRWSLRDNTNYMETGVLAALDYAARNAPDMLRNFWRRGRNAVEKGRKDPPYAVALPEAQDDPVRLASVVNLLRAQGIEVSRSREAFNVKEGAFPAGTYLVRMDQPYRGYALDLLLPQKYPAETAPYEPYDDVAWALPFAWGVQATPIEDKAVVQVGVEPITAPVRHEGRLAARGPVYLVRDSGQEALLAARVRLARFKVEAVERPFSSGGVDYPVGSWVIPAQPGLEPVLDATARELGLEISASDAAPTGPRHLLDLPRLGVLQTWSDTQSAGWVRMVLDDEKVPYTLVMDDDVKRGALRERFDLILYPNTDSSLKAIIGGIDPRFSPLPYTQTKEFPTQGFPTSSPDITGGLTYRGVQNLADFVQRGGVLVTLGGASTLPLDGGIVREVRRATTKNLSTPGSELRASVARPDHPLFYGYKEGLVAFREDRPLYRVRRAERGSIILRWGTQGSSAEDDEEKREGEKKDEKKDDLVVSGGIKGAAELVGKPAIFDFPVGRGRVIAFDFDPIHRYTTVSTFRLVWNAILNWNDLPAPKAP